MKVFKKFLVCSVALIICLGVSMGSACGSDSALNGDINIAVENKGYGHSWVRQIAADFENETGISVVIQEATFEGETAALETNNSRYDLLFLCGELSQYSSPTLPNLTNLYDSVYDAYPYGETSGKKIKDICWYNEVFTLKGATDQTYGYYAIPYANSTTGLLYNKTTLDGIYGAGNYSLPKTSDELFGILDDIYTHRNAYKAYGMVSIGNYFEFLVNTWWAQYDGATAYSNYWFGKGADGTDYTTSSVPRMAQTDGRKYSLQLAKRICEKSDNNYKYLHQHITTFTGNDTGANFGTKAFLGKGYSRDENKIAFMPNGDWFENEAATKDMEGQEVGMIRIPVISNIIELLDDVNDDRTLSAIISKIDDGVEYSIAEYGCRESDYLKIKEARSIVYTLGPCQQAGIPKSSKHKDNAALFLRYMVSNAGQERFAKVLKGLTMCYDCTLADTVQTSDFVTTINSCNKNAKLVYRDLSSPLCYRAGLSAFRISNNGYASLLLTNTAADDIYKYDFTDKSALDSWKSDVKDAFGIDI